MGEKGSTTYTGIMSDNNEAMEKSKVGTEKESMEGEGREISWERPLPPCLASRAKKCPLDFKTKGMF